MRTLIRLLALAVFVGPGLVGTAAATTGTDSRSSAPAIPATPADRLVADTTNSNAKDAPGADAAQSRNAARSRMRECGHQWSSMKKNGAASGMTWKDFSQGCLAKQ
jgi:hypothetical protein